MGVTRENQNTNKARKIVQNMSDKYPELKNFINNIKNSLR